MRFFCKERNLPSRKSKILGKFSLTRTFTGSFPYEGKDRMRSGKKKYHVLSVKKITTTSFFNKIHKNYRLIFSIYVLLIIGIIKKFDNFMKSLILKQIKRILTYPLFVKERKE